jgi:hypothetical protein
MTTREDFDTFLREWYNIVIEHVPYYKDADFKFIVTRDNYSYCFDAKYGNNYLESKWVLEHCDVINGKGLWREYFNTEEELYYWGCSYLKEMTRRHRSIEIEEETPGQSSTDVV